MAVLKSGLAFHNAQEVKLGRRAAAIRCFTHAGFGESSFGFD
jgi:hypothetical protein